MADSELKQLRDDVAALRCIIDAVLDEHDVDRKFIKACADVLQERSERLRVLEEASDLRGHYERSLP